MNNNIVTYNSSNKEHQVSNTNLDTLNSTVTSNTNRIQAIETELATPCTLRLNHISSNYTVQNNDNVIVASGNVTITIDLNVLVEGRQIQIYQDGAGKVVLRAANASKTVKPRLGSLELGGDGAAVSVLHDKNKTLRIVGDTKNGG